MSFSDEILLIQEHDVDGACKRFPGTTFVVFHTFSFRPIYKPGDFLQKNLA